ncbi:MAG: energy transducer TonB [Dissulfurimicrobium sp.]|uniref:energy transducer TonB n=1 Tax=Dissulfurimicrobium sp. TaxID=2022436 RepID=UPI00404AFCC4
MLIFAFTNFIKYDKRPPIVIDFSIKDSTIERLTERHSTEGVKRETKIEKPVAQQAVAKVMARRPVQSVPLKEKVIASVSEREPVHEVMNETPAKDEGNIQSVSHASSNTSNTSDGDRKTPYSSVDQTASNIEGQKDRYIKEHFAYIRDLIMQNLSYPMMARKMGWSGRVVVSFTVLDDGHVEDIKVVETSGFNILDKNAIKTIEKTAPFPRPPVKAELIIPIVYKIESAS